MENFESNFIQSHNNKPLIWWRYVDDIFSIYPYNDTYLSNFLDYLNNQERTIKFTIEKEANTELPFLDVL